jgi:hypothetical protein
MGEFSCRMRRSSATTSFSEYKDLQQQQQHQAQPPGGRAPPHCC